MSSAKKRVQPAVTSHVNRNLDRLFVNQLTKVVMKSPEPWKVDKRGNPHAPQIILMCLILKIFWCETYDGIESKLKAHQEWLCDLWGVKRLPTHSVIHKGMEKVPTKVLRRTIKRVIGRVSKKLSAAADSSGFSTRNSSVWFDIRIKRKNKRKDCVKLHIIIDVKRGYILDFHISDYKKNDCPILNKLLRDINYLEKLLADSGYLSRKSCNLIAKRSGKAYILPKKNSIVKQKGSSEWKVMVKMYKEDKSGFLKEYHERSIIEAVFSSIKKRWGSKLRSIKKWLQRKELSIKVLCYNIKEYLYNKTAKQLGIDRWFYISEQ